MAILSAVFYHASNAFLVEVSKKCMWDNRRSRNDDCNLCPSYPWSSLCLVLCATAAPLIIQ